MNHIAIMKKSWGLTQKILTGEKTIEERWYKFKRAPYGVAKAGDIIYFKDSGKPVSVKAQVTKVLQFENLTPEKSQEIVKKYAHADLGGKEITKEIKEYTSNKNYCVVIFFENPKGVKPFEIDKKGFGLMAAWITVKSINEIKR